MKRLARLAPWLTLLAIYVVAATQATNGVAVASCLVWLASYRMLRKTSEPFDLSRITIPTFWYMTYLAMIYFPAFFVYADQEGPYRGRYLFAVEITLLSVPIGCLLASGWSHSKKPETERFFRQPTQAIQISPGFLRAFAFLLLAAVALTVLYIRVASIIPLFYLLRHPVEYLELATLREESFKLLDSPFKYAYAVVRGVIYLFLILVSLGCYLQTRQKRWFWAFAISLTVGVLFAALTLAKEPVAAIFLVLMLFAYYYKRGVISPRFVAAFLVLILFFPVAVIISASQGSAVDVGVWKSLLAIGTRLLYSPAEVVYYYFEVFPSRVGFLHGRSIGKLSWVLGLPYFDTPNYVGQYGWPSSLESISANGAFIADLNADFGLFGVLLGGILAGAIMQTMHVYLIRQKKTVITLAGYAFLVFIFWKLQSTSLPTVLASEGALFALFLTWMLGRLTSALPRLDARISPSQAGSEQLA